MEVANVTPADNLAWAHRLECPSFACSDTVKKILSKEITGFLWDNISDTLYSTSEVTEVRKNILLHRLKCESKEPAIQYVKSRVQLREKRDKLDAQIDALEKKREYQDLLLRQKAQQLVKTRSIRRSLQTRKELFIMKYNQMHTQVYDCKQMRQICQRLMPPSRDNIQQAVINKSLALVSSLSFGADRRQVWKEISETSYPVQVSVLWNALLQNLSMSVKELVQLGTGMSQTDNISKDGEKIDVGIATICGQHVAAVTKRLLHDAKANGHQQHVMKSIERIEMKERNIPEVSEWLALALEVRKLETEEIVMQNKIDNIKKTFDDQTMITFNDVLSQIASEMHRIDIEREECIQDIQKSFTLLKSAGLSIGKTKEKLIVGLQRIAILRNESQDISWLNIDLSTELNAFYDNVEIGALRKIKLGGDIGTYRYANCCFSEAAISITGLQSHSNSDSIFPMIYAPIYHLLDCYKGFITSSWFKNLQSELPKNIIEKLEEWAPLSITNNTDNTIELLNFTDLICERIRKQIQQFHLIFEAWSSQSVQEAMMFNGSTVYGMTFKEWLQRYNMLSYMLEGHN